jgi:chromosomal replication initiator protein
MGPNAMKIGEEIWRRSLAALETRVAKQSFDTWFKPLAIDSFEGYDVSIAVPNTFFGDWLREHYHDLLLEELSRASERSDLRLQFVVRDAGPSAGAAPAAEPEPARARRSQSVNPRYTFDSFVVGSCNQFAHAACLAVAESPARAYNPLFLYGGVGLGKTHLLNAIGNFISAKKPATRIAYLSSEQFTNEVINSIRYDKMLEFRNKYRGVDMLLVDDIQFIAGKERTQEEFFHTFNTLYEAQKQIVISSDRFPKEMPTIEERLRSRFEWGLIADLQSPDLETKIAILKRKAEVEAIGLTDDVALFLATHIKTNIRELEGSLIRLGAFSSLTGQLITEDLAKKVLRDTITEKKRILTLEEIERAAADKFHVKPAELKSKRRTKTLVYPRQIAMYLCRELTERSYPEIGKYFGGKDHTTVMHACRQIERQMETDPSLKTLIEALVQQLRG